MSAARQPWSAGAHPAARLSAAIVASVALHLGALPSLIPGQPGPGQRAADFEALRVRLEPRREEARAKTAAAGPLRSSSTGDGAAVAPLPGPTRRGLPAASEPRYFTASDLDHRPQPLLAVEPRYPAGGGGRAGRVVLNVFIHEDGHVDKVVLVSGDARFGESAVRAFSNTLFSPGVRHGVAVRSQMLIEVTYRPDEPDEAAPAAEG